MALEMTCLLDNFLEFSHSKTSQKSDSLRQFKSSDDLLLTRTREKDSDSGFFEGLGPGLELTKIGLYHHYFKVNFG